MSENEKPRAMRVDIYFFFLDPKRYKIGANSLLGIGNYAATTALNGGQFTLGGIISSIVFGSIAGTGGSGLMDGSNSIINAFISFTGKII